MVWTKLSDDFLEREALLDVSRDAQLLLVELYLYSNRLGTDGAIHAKRLARATTAENPKALAAELVASGVITATADGYAVPWEDQIRKDEVDRQRAETTARKKRSRQHHAGDHSDCLPRYCSSVTRDKTSDTRTQSQSESRPPGPARPDPPDPSGGKGSGGTAAHVYVPDDSDLSCERCDLPQENRVHQTPHGRPQREPAT